MKCYLPTRLLFMGHLQRSRKHFNTWSVYKTIPRLKTRSLTVTQIVHGKSGFSFTSIPSLKGSLGTAVVVGPRAFARGNRLLPDAVTQQLTSSPRAGASDSRSRLEGEVGLGTRRSTVSLSSAPSGIIRYRPLMNNAHSGGVPDPEVELPSHRSG